jgi:Fuc2NAc and GlcNAc transferase
MPQLLLLTPVFSLLISLLAVWFIKKRFSSQLLDIPNDRSSHTEPTPRGGGLGFIIAFALLTPFVLPVTALLPLYLTLIPLTIVGLIDDQQGVTSKVRYLVQFLTASIAIGFLGAFTQPWLIGLGLAGQIIAVVLTLVGFTAIINFYNFMDGLDGLVAGCSFVQISFLALYLHQPHLWILAAAILGFLYWNWSPAKIFMGDCGSTFLGAIIAFSLISVQDPVIAWSALAIVLPLVTDAIYTLTRRLLKKENIFQAHRSHLYQRLQQTGIGHSTVASLYIGINLAIGLLIYTTNYLGAITSIILTISLLGVGELYLQKKTQPIAQTK